MLRAILLVLALALLSPVAGCMSSQPHAGLSPSETLSPSVSPTPTSSPMNAYVSPVWGYALRYPASWSQVSTTMPAQVTAFSNEDVTLSNRLADLDEHGVFFEVIVAPVTPACPGPATPESDAPLEPITVDGTGSVLRSTHATQGTPKPLYYLQVNAARGPYCYTLNAAFAAPETRDAMKPDYSAVVASFRFGTPSSPPF